LIYADAAIELRRDGGRSEKSIRPPPGRFTEKACPARAAGWNSLLGCGAWPVWYRYFLGGCYCREANVRIGLLV